MAACAQHALARVRLYTLKLVILDGFASSWGWLHSFGFELHTRCLVLSFAG